MIVIKNLVESLLNIYSPPSQRWGAAPERVMPRVEWPQTATQPLSSLHAGSFQNSSYFRVGKAPWAQHWTQSSGHGLLPYDIEKGATISKAKQQIAGQIGELELRNLQATFLDPTHSPKWVTVKSGSREKLVTNGFDREMACFDTTFKPWVFHKTQWACF